LLSPMVYGQTYHFKHYTANDGLPTNAVYGGIQDKKGFIWFYTEHGVSRFDGYQFRNFTVQDGLPVNDVWLIAEDKLGRIWINTFGKKLVAIEGDSVKTYYESHSPDFQAFDFITNDDGDITIYERGTGQLLVPDSCCGVQKLSLPDELDNIPNNKVFHCHRDTFIRFYQNEAKISKIANGGFREDYLIGTRDSHWSKLDFNTRQSRAYWQGKLFVWSFQDSLLHSFAPSLDSLYHFNLNKIFGDTPSFLRYLKLGDQLQVQTNLGLLVINESMEPADTLRFNSPAQGDIHRSFKDREGNYWICSKSQGVFFLTASQRNTKLFTFENRYKPGITHLKRSGDGTIIAGTRNGALLQLSEDNRLIQLLPELEEQLNDSRNVNAICFRNKTHFWVARPLLPLEFVALNGKQAYTQPINFTNLPIEGRGVTPNFNTNNLKEELGQGIKDLDWHPASQRLCVARGAHPYILHYEGKKTPQRLELLTAKRTYACAFEPSGTVWLGHIDGLAQFTSKDGYTPITTPEALKNVFIRELVFDDHSNTLWIGTDGKGVLAYRNGAVFQIEGTAGLSINSLDINADLMFAATNKGAQQIRITNPVEGSYLSSNYGIRQGLPSVEANAIVADSNAIYVGGTEGVAKIAKQEQYFNFRPPLLYFSGIEADGIQQPSDTAYLIKGAPYQLSFKFSAISFKSLGNIRYYYQLVGEDDKVLKTEARSIRYTNLSPGTYTFTVQAEDSNQQRGDIYKTKVVINSNFWHKSQLWIFAILALLISVWILHRWRLHRLRQKSEQETATNRQFAELELQALQAQMNPHFVFNSLSAIQYFIAANERKQADTYLSKFAMLMRQFLESSKSRYLNLQQELHLIKLYIELEQMRFPDRFEAVVEVSSKINPYTTLVPTMLLQPFVENAINHGLFHKMAKGRLSLIIKKNANQALVCTLEDNGVGRAAAKGIQQQTGKAYRSRAMQITSERLNALSVIEGYDVDIKIIDLKKDDGTAAGTRVIITVPEIE